jgi:hypothetical protein
MTPPKLRNSLETDFKDIKVDEIPDKESKRIIFKKLSETPENINSQMKLGRQCGYE